MSSGLALSFLLLVAPLTPHPHDPHRHGAHGQRPRHGERRDDSRVSFRFPLWTPFCQPFFPGHFFNPWPGGFFTESVIIVDSGGPPVLAPPLVWSPFPVVWFEPVFVPPPPVAVPPPVPAFQPRPMVPTVTIEGPRAGTTDIPERLVEDLIGRRRPSLAQRAQAARLDAGGDRLFHAGHFLRAAERYQQVINQTPDHDEARFKRGAALAAAGHYGEAGRVLRDALRERPDWPFVPHDLPALFPDAASIAQLLEHLEREARRLDAESDLLFLRAYFLYFTGQRDAAAEIFRNPPPGGSTVHFTVFAEAIERQRQP